VSHFFVTLRAPGGYKLGIMSLQRPGSRPLICAMLLTFVANSCAREQTNNAVSSGSSQSAVDSSTAPALATAALDVGVQDIDQGPEAIDATAPNDASASDSLDVLTADGAARDVNTITRTRSRPATGSSAQGNSPTTSTTAANPVTAEGQALFDRTCGRCHPNGNERVGPRLVGLAYPEARLRNVVRTGQGTMRAINETRLSDADLGKIVTYLRTLRAVR
jgi:cytochrome c553